MTGQQDADKDDVATPDHDGSFRHLFIKTPSMASRFKYLDVTIGESEPASLDCDSAHELHVEEMNEWRADIQNHVQRNVSL
eukprot:4957012-Prymnesium_polylepis.1